MKTAKELKIDNFVFSYLGVHDPHHREYDAPPVMPFGVFIDAGEFAFTHGNPRDRDFNKNDKVNKDELEYYFLKQNDLKKIITWRIKNDPLFSNDFWKYFGKHSYWVDPNFVENHWKDKAELCFYEKVPLNYIRAILWPVWEDRAHHGELLPDDLQEIDLEVKKIYRQITGNDLNITYYRPYGQLINQESWEKGDSHRDWEFNLLHASSYVQEYFNQHGTFPHEIIND